MLVETYEIQEVAVNKEEIELHKEMAEKLGLKEQVNLHTGKKLSAYRKITAEELFVFSENFPNTVKIEEYKEYIPIRALQAVALYREMHPGLQVMLMCPEPGKVDPVIVGSQYYWRLDGDAHLICRFGEALEEFSVLRNRAFESLERKTKVLKSLSFQKLLALHDVFAKD